MLSYLIDAFNLIYKIRSIENSTTPHQDFIEYLRKNHLTGSSKNKVNVVFDGHEPSGLPRESEFKIYFSDDRTADDIIKTMIDNSKQKKNLIVVSDDREIRNYASISGVRICRPKEFLSANRKKSLNANESDDNGISVSEMIEITEEMEKEWLKK